MWKTRGASQCAITGRSIRSLELRHFQHVTYTEHHSHEFQVVADHDGDDQVGCLWRLPRWANMAAHIAICRLSRGGVRASDQMCLLVGQAQPHNSGHGLTMDVRILAAGGGEGPCDKGAGGEFGTDFGGRTGVRTCIWGLGRRCFSSPHQGPSPGHSHPFQHKKGLCCTVGSVADLTVAPGPPSRAVRVAAGVSRRRTRELRAGWCPGRPSWSCSTPPAAA